MLGKVALGINPEFLDFLAQLRTKKEGEPFIFWQESLDFLTVIIGEGDCGLYALGGWVAPFLDTIHKLFVPMDCEDSFVGFEISGGIQMFLRNNHKQMLGERYEEFRTQHNEMRHEYRASELLEKWLESFPADKPDEISKIRKALRKQDPTIHIPL